MRTSIMRKFAALIYLAILASPSLSIADPVVPANRRIDWTYAGVPGGIPNRTTICATFGPSATAASINAAISTCNNGVVSLSAGTYTAASLGGSISVSKSNVTLRGAGANQTIFSTGGGYLTLNGNYGTALGTAITSGATKGSASFVVASTANLSVGTMIEINMLDDPNVIPFFGSWSPSNGRSITQQDVITAISGTTITVRNPLVYDFSTGCPQVRFYYAEPIVRSSGIENIGVDLLAGGGAGVSLQGCDSCWVRGMEIKNGGNYMILVNNSVNLELRENWIHDGGIGPNHSGISILSDYRYGGSSSAKIENNIINKTFPNIEINNDTSGLYVGYNYSPGTNGGAQDTVTFTLDDSHGSFPIMDLFEGNIADQYGADGFWGGSAYGTALRNYLSGYDPNVGSPKGGAIAIRRLSYYYNIVGNVLGSLAQAPSSYMNCQLYNNVGYIYETLGLPNFGNCSTTNNTNDTYTPPGGYPDQKVAATLLRWGNYDYFNAATRFVSSEIPTGVAIPGDQVIPNSFYYASKPAWFPDSVPWPPIGPDVTGGNGDTSGHVNKIPAQIAAETCSLLTGGSFNAAACFPAAGCGVVVGGAKGGLMTTGVGG